LQYLSLANSKGVAGDCESEEPVPSIGKAGGKCLSLRTETSYKEGCVGDVAKETEALYCTEHINVNEEAT